MTTIMRHAYFSQKQKDIIFQMHKSNSMNKSPNTNIYLTVDGREVEVTEIIKTKPNDHPKNFSDSQYLGMVTKWLRVKY